MSNSVPFAQVIRPKTPETYDRRRTEESYQALEADLSQKHDKRSDLVLQPGKRLVLSDSGLNTQYAIGVTDGQLALTDYTTGVVGEFLINWTNVEGLEQQLVLLTSAFEAGDSTLQSAIDSVASANSSNTSAIATLSTALTAETSARNSDVLALQNDVNSRATINYVDGINTNLTSALATSESTIRTDFAEADSSLASSINTNTAGIASAVSAIASGDAANASAAETLFASSLDAFSYPNVLLPQYQIISNSSGSDFYFVYGEAVSTTYNNPWTMQPSMKVILNHATKTGIYIHCHPASDQTPNMILQPARYGVKVSGLFNSWYRIVCYLRRSDNSAAASMTHYFSGVGADETVDFVLDLTSEPTGAEYYLEFFLGLTGPGQGTSAYLHRMQVRELPDAATTAGSWYVDPSTATTSAIQQVLTTPDSAEAYYGIQANANGVVSGFSAMSLNGPTGQLSRLDFDAQEVVFTAQNFKIKDASSDLSVFEVSGGVIYLNGPVVRTQDIEPGSVTSLVYTSHDSAISLNSSYKTILTRVVTTKGGKVAIIGAVTLEGSNTSSALPATALATIRIRRGSTVIRTMTKAAALFTAFEGANATIPIIEADDPAAGTHTYTIEAKLEPVDPQHGTSGLQGSAYNRTLNLFTSER